MEYPLSHNALFGSSSNLHGSLILHNLAVCSGQGVRWGTARSGIGELLAQSDISVSTPRLPKI